VITVLDDGRPVSYSFDDLLRFHAGNSPGGVAHAYKVMERGLALLAPDGPVERRGIEIRTAFGGPGVRDAFECATGAVGDGRYAVDPEMARPELGRERERFVFRLSHGDAAVTLVLREGFVPPEFIDLVRTEERSEAEERRLTELKTEMAGLVSSAPAEDVYDAELPD
jgi:hypothetical protein